MQLEHQFTVPVPVAQAWDVLLDVERIAPCMPGATVVSFDGENVEGRVKVKVGPIQVTYAGTAKFIDKDEANRKVTIDAKGKEARGSGTAAATIHTQLIDEGGTSTRVTVTTDLAITGKPAQFGRGVMVEVGNKLLGRFAECLHEEIAAGEHAGEPEIAAATAVTGEADASAAASSSAGSAAGSADSATTVSPAVPASQPDPQLAAQHQGEPVVLESAESVVAGTAGAVPPSPLGDGSVGPAAPGDETTPAGVAMPATSSRPAPVSAAPSAAASPLRTATRRPENEAIDLLDAAGPAVLKRLLPLVAGLVAVLLLWRLARRR